MSFKSLRSNCKRHTRSYGLERGALRLLCMFFLCRTSRARARRRKVGVYPSSAADIMFCIDRSLRRQILWEPELGKHGDL